MRLSAAVGMLILLGADLRAQADSGLAGTWALDTAHSRVHGTFGWPPDTVEIISIGHRAFRLVTKTRSTSRRESRLLTEWPLDSVRKDLTGRITSAVFNVEDGWLVGSDRAIQT